MRFEDRYNGSFFFDGKVDRERYLGSVEFEGVKYDIYKSEFVWAYVYFGPDQDRDYYEEEHQLHPILRTIIKLTFGI